MPPWSSRSADRCVLTGCEHVFVSGEATILHADVDAFFASVEQRDEPRLRGKPVIVGGGVVLAASYEARAFGVRSAMGGASARRLCPQSIVVSPRFGAYVEASRAVFAVFKETAPTVEGLSMEEAFLDVAGLERISGTPPAIAARLKEDVLAQAGLTITVGVARTKALAKVASAAAKPDGLLVVPPDGEIAFLHPLAVERLWGVGPATAARLHERGIETVGQLAALDVAVLTTILGPAGGRHLHALSHGRDPRPVRSGRRRRSFGAQSAFGRRSRSAESLDAVILGLVERVTRRMRSSRQVGRTLVLRIRFDDYSRASRSRTLGRPTAATAAILAAARTLLAQAMPVIEQRGLTLLGVTVSNLESDRAAPTQLTLPLASPSESALDTVLDSVRERFGSQAVTRATLLGSDPEAHGLPPPSPG